MCGIAGLISRLGVERTGRILQNMVARIGHRGPDAQAVKVLDLPGGRTLGLGHTRLSIIDLATGDQPLISADGRYSLIFNGEIYNYLELKSELQGMGVVFRTSSDTEVLLEAYIRWGVDALARLRGMFAFALWDNREQSLTLARDHFGEKPLFVCEQGDNLFFASEIAALAAGPEGDLEVDSVSLASFLMWKYVPEPSTFVKGMRQLKPGTYAVWQGGRLQEKRFYQPPAHTGMSGNGRTSEAQIDEFRERLTHSVRLRMRSDVEVGAFLSGGLDSSVIVSLMVAETEKQVKTFSVGFKEKGFDELWAARIVAGEFGTDHHEIVIEPQHYLDTFEKATWHRGAPMSEFADVPVFYLSQLAARSLKVVLSGEGADELLGGYPKHWGERIVKRMHRLSHPALDRIGLDMARMLLPVGNHRIESMMRALGERRFIGRQAAWFGSVPSRELEAIAPNVSHLSQMRGVWPEDPGADTETLSRSLLFDQMVWLPSTLLARADRMTMANSLEGRMPFLDPDLAAFVATLPPDAFIEQRIGKKILRRAMGHVIPQQIIDRPKHGFRVPISAWFRDELREFAHDTLLSPSARVLQFLSAAKLTEILREHDRGERDRHREIWSILSLEIFLRQLGNNFASPIGPAVPAPIHLSSPSLAVH